jgi:IclR family KDG regulon transcriptional repressor
MKNKNNTPEVSTAVRFFETLEVISNAKPHIGISPSEVANNLHSSKSTVFRYLQTMERLGVIEKNERDNYHLGWKILNLASSYLNNMDLPSLAEPYMRELASKSQETIHLAVPSDNWIMYISKVDSPQSIQMIARIGTRNPMYCTALGKSILAFMPEEKVEEVIQLGLHPRTSNTLTNPDELKKNLEEIRQKGYSVDDIENEEGVRCIGTPIFNYRQNVIGAVSLSGPAIRITPERFSELGSIVKDTGLAISRRMGYPK